MSHVIFASGPSPVAQLFGAQTRSAHKVRPPMIVREGFIFFPFIHPWSAHQHYVFTPDRRRGLKPSATIDNKHTNTRCFIISGQEDYFYAGRKIAQL